jgi:hypothetical protein
MSANQRENVALGPVLSLRFLADFHPVPQHLSSAKNVKVIMCKIPSRDSLLKI